MVKNTVAVVRLAQKNTQLQIVAICEKVKAVQWDISNIATLSIEHFQLGFTHKNDLKESAEALFHYKNMCTVK